MDLLTLFIGVFIGLVVGLAIAWFWINSLNKSRKSAQQSMEAELKALLAQQATSHLLASRETIQSIESNLASLRNSVADYEKSLAESTSDTSQSTYFGEHASMFLRNTDKKSDKSKSAEHPDNQPKDFANSGSGVFVGSANSETINIEEKITK